MIVLCTRGLVTHRPEVNYLAVKLLCLMCSVIKKLAIDTVGESGIEEVGKKV